MDVGDDGRIYVITHSMVEEVPKGLDYMPTPCLLDFLDVVSPDGKRIKRISLLQAFKDSPYAALLCTLETDSVRSGPDAIRPRAMGSAVTEDLLRRDVLHTNAVCVLSRRLAPWFPMFRAGQVLISPRHLDAIAVLDPDSEKIVWAARGPWHAQHEPAFLGNGHLLLFDNLGSPKSSRVLEYDPVTQAFPWSYPGDRDPPFLTKTRGMAQRLANGNTLIVNSQAGEVLEVTADHEQVWSCSCGTELYRARRYTAEEVPFLSEDRRARGKP
jgi:hypothetical protein